MATIKVKFSNTYNAKRKRIKRLPKLYNKSISGAAKKSLIGMNKIFHDGIRDNELGLIALSSNTVESKRRKGNLNPSSPLYGMGDAVGKNSYSNMLILTKRKNGWKLSPSRRKHHSGKVTLKELFQIHEHGGIVKKQSKKGDMTLIRIPPRPAFLLSYRKWLQEKKENEKETAKEVLDAMEEFINKGNKKIFNRMDSFNKREE